MKKELLLKGTKITNKGNNYTVVELKEDSVIVEGIKGIKELKLSTVTKNFKLIKESKEEAKTLVEEALEEAGISTKLGKIGEKVEASKEEVEEGSKEVEASKEESAKGEEVRKKLKKL